MFPDRGRRMEAAKLEVTARLLDQQRRAGGDRFDEVWDGVLHMVPPPSIPHQDLAYELERVLRSIAARRRLRVVHNAGLRDPGRGWKDYRVPDLSVVRPDQLSDQAIEGRAELVVEILSPRDESREKLAFYARRGVREVWLIEPGPRQVEAFTRRIGGFVAVAPVAGVVWSSALELELRVVAGPRLRIADGPRVAEV